jgi:hypothetical protein
MIEKLKAQLAKLRRMQFRQSSEKFDAAIHQLELALEDVEEDTAARTVLERALMPAAPGSRRHPVRRPLPDHLPREEVVHWPEASLVAISAVAAAPVAGNCAGSARTRLRCLSASPCSRSSDISAYVGMRPDNLLKPQVPGFRESIAWVRPALHARSEMPDES